MRKYEGFIQTVELANDWNLPLPKGYRELYDILIKGGETMTDNEIIKAWDILAKLDFFGGQRAGRELWNEKPVDVQNEDIENFTKDIAFLKEFINRQKAEIERLKKLNSLSVHDCGVKYARMAIKEFAERVKYELFEEDYLLVEPCQIAEIIDYVTDEFIKEEKQC